MRTHAGGDLAALQTPARQALLVDADRAALQRLAGAYLALQTPHAAGDPVARFHLDNGARLERINVDANRSASGLRQSFGLMVNYLYDLDQIEANHTLFKRGEVARSRAVQAFV